MGDWLRDLGTAFNNTMNQANRAAAKGIEETTKAIMKGAEGVARAPERFLKEWGDDFQKIGDSFEKGGLLAGGAQIMDTFSAGNIVQNDLVTLGLLPSDNEALKEGVAAGVNLFSGNPIGLKDAAEAFTALRAPSAMTGVRAAKAQSADRPSRAAKKDHAAGFNEQATKQSAGRLTEKSVRSCGCFVAAKMDLATLDFERALRSQGVTRSGVDSRSLPANEVTLDIAINDPNLSFHEVIDLVTRIVARDRRDELVTQMRADQQARRTQTSAESKPTSSGGLLNKDMVGGLLDGAAAAAPAILGLLGPALAAIPPVGPILAAAAPFAPMVLQAVSGMVKSGALDGVFNAVNQGLGGETPTSSAPRAQSAATTSPRARAVDSDGNTRDDDTESAVETTNELAAMTRALAKAEEILSNIISAQNQVAMGIAQNVRS